MQYGKTDVNRFPVSAHTMGESTEKGGVSHELSCQQVHRMHRPAVCIPLRERELLLPGPDPGGHPREQSHRGAVHRLQVLPEEVMPGHPDAAA